MHSGRSTIEGEDSRTILRSHRAPRAEHVPRGALVLTGRAGAAAALGVPYLSPARYAGRLHLGAGGAIASRLTQWRTLRRAIDDDAPTPDPAGVQRLLAAPVRELLRIGLDGLPDDVSLSAASERAVRVARRYRALLEEGGEIDPAEIFWAAARAARAAGRSAVLAVLGAGPLDPDACAFLDAVAGSGSVVVLGWEEERSARRLGALGWTVREEDEAPERSGERLARAFLGGAAGTPAAADAVAHGFASQEAEVRWVLGRVKALLRDGVPAGDIVLAARDDAAISAPVAAVAWEFGVPVRASHGVALRETRLGGWISALHDVVRRGLPHEETAQLLGHRLTGGLSGDAWREVRTAHPVGVEAWARVDARAEALAWPQEDGAGGWAARFEATLASFGLADEQELPPADAAVLRTLLHGIADARRPEGRRVERSAFLRDLEDLLTLLTVRKDPRPRPDEPEAVELHALHALAGARVPHVFVLGAVEGGLPAELRDDPVLDFRDRSVLARRGVGIASAAGRARDEEAAFAALLRAADGPVTFTVPGRIGGRALLPSPYLSRLGLSPVAAPVLPAASPEERRMRVLQHATGADALDPVLTAARRAWRVERARESAAPHDVYDGMTGMPVDPASRTLSATQIVELGSCPFAWFGHRILGVREREEVEEVLSPRLRGVLWHAALEGAVRAGVERCAEPGDAALLREAVVTALPEAFARAEADVGVPAGEAWRKVREGELRALERAVRADDFVSSGAVPAEFERRFRGTWRGLRVGGVVDRIDLGPAGVELIDYKSGTSAPKGAKDASGWGWIDVQLPLYLEAAAPEIHPDRPLATARYLSVRSGETLRTARPGANEAALEGLAERVRDHLAAGAFPVDPDPRQEACRTCDLAAVCRVGPRVDRKRDARREETGEAVAGGESR